MDGTPLFPNERMELGSNGAGVRFLQYVLLVMRCNAAITPDGQFGPETEKGVKNLQGNILVMPEADGRFGPRTRARLQTLTGLNVNELTEQMFTGGTNCVFQPD